MVYFVGAGSGAADLITVRGMHMLQQADVIIYAGSLVNPELLEYARADCEIHNSAHLTLEEVLKLMQEAQAQGKMLVRLHTGEPSIYGAVREQMDALDELGIPYESCPGVSACFGAAASLNLEYTLPGVSQTLIITRMEGRTGVPQKESIESLAAHHASMAIYLSTGMLRELSHRLISGTYVMISRAIRDIRINGIAPLATFNIGCLVILAATNRFRPKGGVNIPMAAFTTITIPK